MTDTAFLNPGNIDFMMTQPRRSFSWIGFDSIDDCNLHCLYCHNPRTKKLTDADQFRKFLTEKVEQVRVFQIGCAMEPSLDPRMVDFLEAITDTPAHPIGQFKVHTNGTLLNRHDPARMLAAGLTHLSVSIDTANEDTFARLRGGAKLDRVFRNIKKFHRACPDVTIQFIATVNKANVDEMDLLIEKGIDVGASRFHFREMFHSPGGRVVDDQKVAELVLEPGVFERMQARIEADYLGKVGLFFGSSGFLITSSKNAKASSFPSLKPAPT